MGRPVSPQPTDLELEILKILWRDGPSTARHIREAFPASHTLSASSVHIALKVMRQKGYLERERRSKMEGGSRFRALISQHKTAQDMLKYVIRKIFGGKAKPAVQNLLSIEDISAKELAEIDALIRKKKQEKRR